MSSARECAGEGDRTHQGPCRRGHEYEQVDTAATAATAAAAIPAATAAAVKGAPFPILFVPISRLGRRHQQ